MEYKYTPNHPFIEMCYKGAASIGDSIMHQKLLASCLTLPYWSKETKIQELHSYEMYFKIREQLRLSKTIPRKKLMNQSLMRLKLLVDYAFSCIPFYNELYKKAGFSLGEIRTFSDFKSLPLLDKVGLRELYQSQIDDGIVSPYRSTTSGSSGYPLILLNDEVRTCYWYSLRLNMFEHMLSRVIEKKDWIYNFYYEPFYLSQALGNFKTFNIGIDAPISLIVEHIRKLRPHLITGVANRVLQLSEYFPDISNYGVEVISTNSESSTSGQRRKFEKILGINILDEYSSEELGIIAWEDRNSKEYVVAEDSLFLELLEIGHFGTDAHQVVGTCFNSLIMPRIRYVQGDFAEWADDSAEGDFEFSDHVIGPRYLSQINGRSDMAFIRADGTYLQSSLILGLIDRYLLKASHDIKQFRLIQKNTQEIILLILGSPSEIATTEIQNFLSSLDISMGKGLTQIEVHWVKEIPPIKNKHRCIIRDF